MWLVITPGNFLSWTLSWLLYKNNSIQSIITRVRGYLLKLLGICFLFLLERRFSAVRLDACVGFVISYTLGVLGFHICLWQDCYRGGPNTVVAERWVDFCVERHRTHHGAQITDSKWWITKPNLVRFWIELAAYSPWSLEEDLHFRIEVGDVIFHGLYWTLSWTRNF